MQPCSILHNIERGNGSKIDVGRGSRIPKIKFKSARGSSRGRPMASKSVPQAPRHRPSTSPARPRSIQRVPESGSGHQKDRLEGFGSVPRRPKSWLSRTRKRKKTTFCAQSVHEASLDHFFVNFGPVLICRQSLRTLESTVPASKNKGSALCAASRVAHALQPRKRTKIGPKTTNFATF